MNVNLNSAMLLIDEVIEEINQGFVACNRCGDQEDTKNLDFADDVKEVKRLVEKLVEMDEENERLKKHARFSNSIIHNMVVANQSAWLEWTEGGGAEMAMVWLQNGLADPGHIPENKDKKTPQQWLDSNVVEHHQNQTSLTYN